MNKKSLFIAIISLIIANTYCFFDMFSDNPAYFATRQHQELSIPFLNFELHVDNSLLSFKDIELFDKDRTLTSSDKKLLTKRDFKVFTELNAKLFHYGYRNWDFSFSIHVYLNANIIDKNFSKIVFYGNELDKDYTLNSGKGTYAVSYAKNKISYGNPIPYYVHNTPIYFGANMNIYTPLFFAEVLESSQRFITTPDSSYYDYRMRYAYMDTEEVGNIGVNMGFGFGFKAKLPQGWAYFQIDDLFASLSYKNLAGGLYEGSYIDSLLYLTKDFEPFSRSYENDSLRIADKSYRVSPSLSFGGSYNVYKSVFASLKYSYSDFSYQRGFSFAVNYDIYDWLPLMLVIGSTENTYYELRTGLNFPGFQFVVSPVFYNGFLHRTKGLGLKTGMKVRF